jgi:oxygen-dependent protoporphyrinogen oxidase
MKKQVAILGAGITGLSLGFFLKERFNDTLDIHIFEKSGRAGGWIETIQEGPFQFEKGPRTVRGEAVLELVEKLGLKERLIFPNENSKIRYLLKNGSLVKAPSFQLLKGKKWDLLKGLLKPGSPKEDESVYDFACRRFSKEIAEELVAPMALGIYAGDIKKLSLKHCFPSLFARDQRKVPFILQKGAKSTPFFSFREGLELIPKTLATKLNIHYNKTIDEEDPRFDHVFSTLPNPLVPRNSVAVINLGWIGQKLPIKGFGYLGAAGNVLGVVFDSEIFPIDNNTRITLMMSELNLQEALNHIKEILKIKEKPDFVHQFLAKDAIPQYPIGFDSILQGIYEEVKKKRNKSTLLGSSYQGVSINDCVAGAAKAARGYSPFD